MEIKVFDSEIIITNPKRELYTRLKKELYYKDKSMEFQYNKAKNNPYFRNIQKLNELKNKIHNTLFDGDENKITLGIGFFHKIEHYSYIDCRKKEDDIDELWYAWEDKPFDLRPYQQEAVDKISKNRRGIVCLATGMGKTLLAIHSIKREKKKTLVVCPGKSIANQFYEQLCETFGSHRVGFVGGGKEKYNDITVGTAQTLANRTDRIKEEKFEYIIGDEIHNIAAATFDKLFRELRFAYKVIGLSATPFRNDGRDVVIESHAGQKLINLDIVWGWQNGFLAKPLFCTRKIKTTGKDYRDKLKSYKEHVLKQGLMNDTIIKDIKNALNKGKKVLCLVSEVEHGKLISEATGLKLATGQVKGSRELVNELNNDEIPGLIGTDSFIGEGTDTRKVDVLILANFVAARGKVMQNIGRGTRIYGSKKSFIVIDYMALGSTMLTRHAESRLELFKEMSDYIRILE
jgi:superfamily II DNA or RNA helicase